MNCKFCNAEVTDGAVFCPYCGTHVDPTPSQAETSTDTLGNPISAPAQDTPPCDPTVIIHTPRNIFCGHCGNPVPSDAPVCAACGLPPTTVVTPPEPKKKPKIGLWILAAVASLLVIAVISGLCTNWFGFYGPATKIASAANKTLTAGSFTVDLNMSIESETDYGDISQEVEGKLEVVLDLKEQDLTMFAEIEAADNLTATMAIYDDYLIMGTSGHFSKQDISEELDTFFENYNSTKELNWEELLNSIQDDLYDEVSDVINFDKLEKCLSAYVRKLNNNKWLKENAGYSYTKENGISLYQFKPKNYKFLNASLNCFEDAFIDEDDYEDLVDQLKDSKRALNNVDYDLVLGIKSGKLESFDFEMDQDSTNVKLELEFDKIGETSIDESTLKDMLDKAF